MTQTKSTGLNTTPHFKSNLANFIATMDYKELERKTMLKSGRREYQYPIGDTEGFQRLFENIDTVAQKTYMLEKDVVMRLSTKQVPGKTVVGMALYNGTTHPSILYIQELVQTGNEMRGRLHLSFDDVSGEADLEKLKSELLRFLE